MGASDGARRAVPLNHEPSETIAAPQTIPIHSSQWNIVSRLAKDDSNVAVTSRTFAGEVFYHGRSISRCAWRGMLRKTLVYDDPRKLKTKPFGEFLHAHSERQFKPDNLN